MQKTSAWLVIGCLVLMLAACSSVATRTSGRHTGQTTSEPQSGKVVTVKRGQTLYGIALENRVSLADLAAWNGLAPPYVIYPGQILRLHSQKAASSTQVTKPSATPIEKTVKSDINWRWPAQGEVIGRYVSNDPANQGIDIAGNGGDPVRATADGVVVYSGAGLVGYGELIILKHGDDWLSAYAHNRERLVVEGQNVKAGQQIAEMGRSGAARNKLHFEIRYNSKPVDPLRYLPAR